MSTMSLDLWQLACDRLAAELPEQQFNTWIRPLTASTVKVSAVGEAAQAGGSSTPTAAQDTAPVASTVVAVRVPNRFKLDWIRTQYAARIEALLCDIAGHGVRLELTVAPVAKSDAPAHTQPAMALRRGAAVAAASVAL